MQTLHSLRQRFIGDRAFYRALLRIVLPSVAQMSLTNIVNLLDNIMVGQLGTAELSGVAIGNQMVFVFMICLFGGLAGPGIFGAQYFGAKDLEGVRNTFRLKLWIGVLLLGTAFVVVLGYGPGLVGLYLRGQGEPALALGIRGHALDYLHIMLVGLVPFMVSTVYASTLREGGETLLPMKAGITAVIVNLLGNWLLIFGNLGFPRLGVQGAAIATAVSRFVEAGIVTIASHRRKTRYEFLQGLYRRLTVRWSIIRAVLNKGAPLLFNELLWATGMATLTQVYSVRGLHVLAAWNIAIAVNNMFNVFFISMGTAITVFIGQSLGANRMEQARGDVWRLMFVGFSTSVLIGGTLALLSPYFPLLYNTTEEVRHLATSFLISMGLFMAMYSVSHCCYFTLRSGGSTLMTFLFDAVFMWVISIPLAWTLAHRTGIPIQYLYPLVESAGLLKMVLGLYIVRSGRWVRNIVHKLD